MDENLLKPLTLKCYMQIICCEFLLNANTFHFDIYLMINIPYITTKLKLF